MSTSIENTAAVVLAGGFGRRIGHLLPDLPKPMAPVNGRPFLEWVVRFLAAQNIGNIILSTGHLAEVIERHFHHRPVKNARVRCVRETGPLGTAGGFLNAVRQTGEMPEAWWILNGDSLAMAPFDILLNSLDEAGAAGALLGVRVADASRFGTIAQNARGELAGFNEKQPGAGTISAGVYLFRSGVIGEFPDKTPLSFETDVFPVLIERQIRLKVCVTNAPFLDIGTPESLPQADDFIRQNQKYFEP